MLLKNVKASWLFIKNPDDNGNYRVTFEVSKEQDAEILDILDDTVKQRGVGSIKDCDWQGSRSVNDETKAITYTAKCSETFKSKKGEEISRDLPVYDIKAIKLDKEKIPNVANGAIINIVVEPYYAEYKKKKGAMIGLRSIQLLQYTEYKGENPFEDESGEDNPFKPSNTSNDDESGEDNPPFKPSNTSNDDDIFE
ncbi:hypothetical protein JF110_001849 [Campylobacter jejuni]|nr:hypothetical protein [Campylobacter jejuni]